MSVPSRDLESLRQSNYFIGFWLAEHVPRRWSGRLSNRSVTNYRAQSRSVYHSQISASPYQGSRLDPRDSQTGARNQKPVALLVNGSIARAHTATAPNSTRLMPSYGSDNAVSERSIQISPRHRSAFNRMGNEKQPRGCSHFRTAICHQARLGMSPRIHHRE